MIFTKKNVRIVSVLLAVLLMLICDGLLIACPPPDCPPCQVWNGSQCVPKPNTCDNCSNYTGTCQKTPRTYCIGSELQKGSITQPTNGSSVASSSSITLSAGGGSDSDCYYYTSGDGCFTCSSSQTDAVTVSWQAVWKTSGLPAGTFPSGNTGTSVQWSSPAGSGEVDITATWSDSGTKASDGSKSQTITVKVVAVQKIQYNDPNGWTDVTGTLYAHKSGSIEFKAIKSPADASWPSGKPVWGGSSGASGTGETKNVTFNAVSSSPTDYKTVTAECGNTVTVNVIVCQVEATEVTFDHDAPAPGHNDGLSIYDVQKPEWVKDGQNEPAIYIKDTSNIDIMANFSISPQVNQEVTILATSGSSVLGNLGEVSSVFVSGSTLLLFTAAGSSNSAVSEDTVQWQWKVKDFGQCAAGEININTSGPHTVYTTYDSPVCSQSDFTKDNIDGAVGKAQGGSTESGIASNANDNVGSNVYEECICVDGFQKNFDAAMGSYPTSGAKGMCCCRAEGLDCVLNVLGIGPYTHDYVNEYPEPNTSKSVYYHDCSTCGRRVWRNYWDSFWNNWEGVVKAGGNGSTCYAPANGAISIDEGTYSQIDSTIATDCGYYWKWGPNRADTCPHYGTP